uniref:ATP synthase subunit e, mitochondrial n=1 Tax=Panagrellus redivivus TaxID=6233 RepID=A0A7E4VVF0_PANRE
MWTVVASRLTSRWAGVIAFPVACIVGTIGYYAEKRLRGPHKEIPYLEKSLAQRRTERLMAEEVAATKS